MAAEPTVPPTDDASDSDLLEPGFGTGSEGEGFEEAAGGTD